VAQARQIFDESFLSIRAKLIEVAAALDRIDRASELAGPQVGNPDEPNAANSDADSDPRRGRVEEAIYLLQRGAAQPGQRAAALQQLFSRQYDPQWRQQFDI